MMKFLMNSRRNFLRNAALGTLATLTLPQIVSAATAGYVGKKVKIDENDVIMFQGDSITDWGRNHKATDANTTDMLGNGYTLHAAAELLLKHPAKNLKIFNRGVGGNKVYQLAERWDADCLAFKPNILSIHIGVNDFWHALNGNYDGTIDTYISDYKALIERTQKALPGVQLIIGEPYALRGTKFVDDRWYPNFNLFRQAAKDIANQYGAAFIPHQSVVDKALEIAPASYWSIDGVHPSVAGAKLMAQAWLDTIRG